MAIALSPGRVAERSPVGVAHRVEILVLPNTRRRVLPVAGQALCLLCLPALAEAFAAPPGQAVFEAVEHQHVGLAIGPVWALDGSQQVEADVSSGLVELTPAIQGQRDAVARPVPSQEAQQADSSSVCAENSKHDLFYRVGFHVLTMLLVVAGLYARGLKRQLVDEWRIAEATIRRGTKEAG